MLPVFLWHERWARRLQGGKWERRGDRWMPVSEWSGPEGPDAAGVHGREDWGTGDDAPVRRAYKEDR